jgi:hypothetical protein
VVPDIRAKIPRGPPSAPWPGPAVWVGQDPDEAAPSVRQQDRQRWRPSPVPSRLRPPQTAAPAGAPHRVPVLGAMGCSRSRRVASPLLSSAPRAGCIAQCRSLPLSVGRGLVASSGMIPATRRVGQRLAYATVSVPYTVVSVSHTVVSVIYTVAPASYVLVPVSYTVVSVS